MPDGQRSNGEALLLRVNLLQFPSDVCNHASEAVLELAVFGGIDERVDTAVGEHQYHGEVVERVDTAVGEHQYHGEW